MDFSLDVVWDAVRWIEIILAIVLAGALSRVGWSLFQRRAVKWRFYFVVSMAFFCASSAMNGLQRMGEDPTPRLFLNTAGLIFGVLAARHFVTFSRPNDRDDRELDAL